MFGGRRRGGVVRGVARTAAVAGTATAVSGRVRRRQSNRWAEEQQAQVQQQPLAQAPAPAAPAVDTGDQIAQLERLASLRDQGVLDESEFEVQKAKILAG